MTNVLVQQATVEESTSIHVHWVEDCPPLRREAKMALLLPLEMY